MTTNQDAFTVRADRAKAAEYVAKGIRISDPSTITITDRFGNSLGSAKVDANQLWKPAPGITQLADTNYPITVTVTTDRS
ncbi:hypothetical protein ACFC26_16100 [Kitasatospora purpeofusca]|uniref:hypothetical protein n=1 Tax=Kitasatospora purpeofusca TaxID=67352 RepID=UPI0035D75F95